MNLKKIALSFINALLFARLFIKGKILPGFIPKKDNLVIDIGSGDKPFWRADVFLDNVLLGKEQRFSSADIITNQGIFIDCDVLKTPFEDDSFDFSFCSHLLEHVERPDLAIKEITRISKKGYIEIPDGMLETVFPYQSHLWFVFLVKGELIFIRKSKKIHDALSKNGDKYIYLAKLMISPFIQFYWKKDIKYKIIDDLKTSEKYFSTQNNRILQPEYIQKAYTFSTRIFRKLFYKNKADKLQTLMLNLNKNNQKLQGLNF